LVSGTAFSTVPLSRLQSRTSVRQYDRTAPERVPRPRPVVRSYRRTSLAGGPKRTQGQIEFSIWPRATILIMPSASITPLTDLSNGIPAMSFLPVPYPQAFVHFPASPSFRFTEPERMYTCPIVPSQGMFRMPPFRVLPAETIETCITALAPFGSRDHSRLLRFEASQMHAHRFSVGGTGRAGCVDARRPFDDPPDGRRALAQRRTGSPCRGIDQGPPRRGADCPDTTQGLAPEKESHAAYGTPAVRAFSRRWCCAGDRASILELDQRFDPAILDDDPLIRI
jgi:hypothetical protein